MITFSKGTVWLAVLGILATIAALAVVILHSPVNTEPRSGARQDVALAEEQSRILAQRSGNLGTGTPLTPDLFYSGIKSNAAQFSVSDASTVEAVLEKGLNLSGASPTHLAIRGVPRSPAGLAPSRGRV